MKMNQSVKNKTGVKITNGLWAQGPDLDGPVPRSPSLGAQHTEKYQGSTSYCNLYVTGQGMMLS